VDRGSTDHSMAHFIPTHFAPTVSQLIGSAATAVTRPVECSEPLVEANVIESTHGTAIVLTNWSAQQEIASLRVKVNIRVPGNASMASGAPVTVEKDADGTTAFVTKLKQADVLILR